MYDYTNFSCAHLAQFATSTYMDGIEPVTPFFCSFFSSNYILIEVLPLYSMFDNTLAAQYFGVRITRILIRQHVGHPY